MCLTKVYVHPLSELICFRVFYPNLHDGGFVGLSNAISEKFRSAPESWSLSDGDLSCMQEAKETCVHRPCHDVVEVLRLFVKKIFDLN